MAGTYNRDSAMTRAKFLARAGLQAESIVTTITYLCHDRHRDYDHDHYLKQLVALLLESCSSSSRMVGWTVSTSYWFTSPSHSRHEQRFHEQPRPRKLHTSFCLNSSLTLNTVRYQKPDVLYLSYVCCGYFWACRREEVAARHGAGLLRT